MVKTGADISELSKAIGMIIELTLLLRALKLVLVKLFQKDILNLVFM